MTIKNRVTRLEAKQGSAQRITWRGVVDIARMNDEQRADLEKSKPGLVAQFWAVIRAAQSDSKAKQFGV